MARLINNKGMWSLQINKDQPGEILRLIQNMDQYYLSVDIEEKHYTFQIIDVGNDGRWSISESEYRDILGKITPSPEEDTIIPLELEEPHNYLAFPDWFALARNHPKDPYIDFIKEVGTDKPTTKTNFKWEE